MLDNHKTLATNEITNGKFKACCVNVRYKKKQKNWGKETEMETETEKHFSLLKCINPIQLIVLIENEGKKGFFPLSFNPS